MAITLTIYDSAADCSGDATPAFATNNAGVRIGNNDYVCKVWLPFVVDLAKSTVITSATLKVVAFTSDTGTTVKIKIGCEAADNPSAPTDWTTLNARTMSTSVTLDNNVPSWSVGTEYTYDITTAVQEILNRAGWASGQTMAVMIHDNGSGANKSRKMCMSEHTTYAEPTLVIVYPSPTGMGQVI